MNKSLTFIRNSNTLTHSTGRHSGEVSKIRHEISYLWWYQTQQGTGQLEIFNYSLKWHNWDTSSYESGLPKGSEMLELCAEPTAKPCGRPQGPTCPGLQRTHSYSLKSVITESPFQPKCNIIPSSISLFEQKNKWKWSNKNLQSKVLL